MNKGKVPRFTNQYNAKVENKSVCVQAQKKQYQRSKVQLMVRRGGYASQGAQDVGAIPD